LSFIFEPLFVGVVGGLFDPAIAMCLIIPQLQGALVWRILIILMTIDDFALGGELLERC
jgi:hypothetical protein